jgi:hypothetical protein
VNHPIEYMICRSCGKQVATWRRLLCDDCNPKSYRESAAKYRRRRYNSDPKFKARVDGHRRKWREKEKVRKEAAVQDELDMVKRKKRAVLEYKERKAEAIKAKGLRNAGLR